MAEVIERPGPDEDVEVPIWLDEADAAAWPASNAIRIGAIELRAVLRALDESGISVGLGLIPGTLVRFHPHAVFADRSC
jgi:hypothetical protein